MKHLLTTHQSKHPRPTDQRGFTLIELLLYIAVSAVIMSGILTLLILLMNSRVKNQSIGEVEGQGAFIMQEIGQSIRNAHSITSPAPAATDSALTLAETDAAKDPTVYTLASGVVSVTEGGNGAKPVALNSAAVTVSGLSFQNLSLAGTTSQIVRVSFTVSYVNKTGRDETNYSKTFYNSYSLR